VGQRLTLPGGDKWVYFADVRFYKSEGRSRGDTPFDPKTLATRWQKLFYARSENDFVPIAMLINGFVPVAKGATFFACPFPRKIAF
jgi:hypothetical protein